MMSRTLGVIRMMSYYRTLFDIQPLEGDLSGLDLMGVVEEDLRTWVSESFPNSPDILDDPGQASGSRWWEGDGSLLRLSGGSLVDQGYFWLRWSVGEE